MPAIHAKAMLTAIESIRLDHLWQAQEWCGVDAVLALRMLKIPGPAKVILGAGAANSGIVVIAIQIEFDLALAPPASIVALPGKVGADIMAYALHIIEKSMHLLVG